MDTGYLEVKPGEKSSGRAGFWFVLVVAMVPYAFHVIWRTIACGTIDQSLVYAVIGLAVAAFGGKWAQKREEVKADIAGNE